MISPSRRPLYGLPAAYFVSGVGTAMSAVAIPWLVLLTTHLNADTQIWLCPHQAPSTRALVVPVG